VTDQRAVNTSIEGRLRRKVSEAKRPRHVKRRREEGKTACDDTEGEGRGEAEGKWEVETSRIQESEKRKRKMEVHIQRSREKGRGIGDEILHVEPVSLSQRKNPEREERKKHTLNDPIHKSNSPASKNNSNTSCSGN